MKMNKAIKRIVALGTGITMVGATILGAMAAADLGNYPQPFVKEGAFDALIVVGAAAQSSDVLGSVDIATSLQYANRIDTVIPGTTGSATVTGEGVKIEGSNNDLDIREDFNVAKPSIDDGDLPELLADGTYVADGDDASETFDYTQELAFNAGEVRWFQSNDYDEDYPYMVVYSAADTPFMTYTLEFTKDAVGNFDATGTGCGDADELCDFEGTKIDIMGMNYEVTNAAFDGATALTWEMMGGTGLFTMYEGETKTFTIDGKDYEVTVDIISDTTTPVDCQLTVNGQTTRELSRGETTKVAGIELGIKKLMPNEAGEEDAGKDLVQFYLGANKITLDDSDVISAASADEPVKIGTEDSDVLFVDWTATTAGDELSLQTLQFTWTPDEEVMFEAGESVEFPLGSYKVAFAGLTKPETEEISFKPTGDDKIAVSLPLEGGDVTLDMLYWDGAAFVLGDTDTAGDGLILTANGNTITKGDYVILSDTTEYETHILKLKDITSDDIIKFEDVATGEITEKSCPVAGCTVRVGATDLTVDTVNEAANTAVIVGATSDESTTLYTPEGYSVAFGAMGATVTITLTEENQEGTVGAGDAYTLTADVDGSSETTIGGLAGVSGSAAYEFGDASDIYVTYSDYGTKITVDQSDSRENVEIVYPSEKVFADVFVNGIDTQVNEAGEGGATYGDVQKIEVGAAVLDTEVSSLTAQNTIIVGGPCVNTLAAELIGSDAANCAAGFEDGKAMIKLVEHSNGKMALLVAGYSAMDTRRAARVLGNYEDYEADFEGVAEVEVTGTSLTDINVGAPSVQ